MKCYILKQLFSIFIYFKTIYSCDGKAEFSALLFQSSVSHDPSEIILIYWFGAQETCIIIIIINAEQLCSFVNRNNDTYFFKDFLTNSKFKRTAFIL